MPTKKLKDVTCSEIRCGDCPLQDADIYCGEWGVSETFEEFYLRYKDLLDDIDLEKEIEVNE